MLLLVFTRAAVYHCTVAAALATAAATAFASTAVSHVFSIPSVVAVTLVLCAKLLVLV